MGPQWQKDTAQVWGSTEKVRGNYITWMNMYTNVILHHSVCWEAIILYVCVYSRLMWVLQLYVSSFS